MIKSLMMKKAKNGFIVEFNNLGRIEEAVYLSIDNTFKSDVEGFFCDRTPEELKAIEEEAKRPVTTRKKIEK